MTDPVDARLLAVLADLGKAAVHEVAAKLGMDPREVAYRLVNLSASGLPLLVGVESDPNGLRAALTQQPQQPQQQPWQQAQAAPASPPYGQVQATPSGPQPVQSTPSGPYPVQGAPSGAYPVHGVQGTPSGGYPVQGTPSGAYPPPTAARPWGPPPQQQPPPAAATAPAPPAQQPPPPSADPLVSTWGPPQTALWARGDQPPASGVPARAPQPPPPEPKTGSTGDVLDTEGLEGEQLAVQLLEVQDPADYLFAAAGYSLREGERAVVVHTEITNRGNRPFLSLPDNYLELVTDQGAAIAKAPVSLTSRPPHKIGVQPGETTGGHTVYVLPDATRVVSVRWSRRPEPDERSLIWSIEG